LQLATKKYKIFSMIRIFLIFLFLSVGNAFAQVQKTPDDLISHFFDVFKTKFF